MREECVGEGGVGRSVLVREECVGEGGVGRSVLVREGWGGVCW